MYKLELEHSFLGKNRVIEAKGLKSLFKELTGYNFSKLVRNAESYINELEDTHYDIVELELAKLNAVKNLKFYNSKYWIKHKEANFFSKNSTSIEEFLEDILNNFSFYECLGFISVRFNGVALHNKGVIVIKSGFKLLGDSE